MYHYLRIVVVNNLSEKSRRLLRAVYRGLGVTTASLTVMNCGILYNYGMDAYGMPAPEYGMPPYYQEDILIQGWVKSKKNGSPIPGIGIWIEGITVSHANLTDNEGKFYIYAQQKESYTIIFTDIDGANQGQYKQHSVTLTREEALALRNEPLVIELEADEAE